MDKRILGELSDAIVEISRKAGRAVMDVYGTEFTVDVKADKTPLTLADKKSNEIITEGLLRLTPDIPVFSEEGREMPYKVRKTWDLFYLVDPLDGTKEFINRNGDFTVNIALVEGRTPVLGVIYLPVLGTTYYAWQGAGAFRMKDGSAPERISARKEAPSGGLVAVASRSHGSPETEAYLSKYKISERVSRGSSLKLCLVAEGAADIYPRLAPTWEWDTAAGYVIVTEAGGRVVYPNGKDLIYNKEVPKNDNFIAYAPSAGKAV